MPVEGKGHVRWTFPPKGLDVGIIVASFSYSDFFSLIPDLFQRTFFSHFVDKRLDFFLSSLFS